MAGQVLYDYCATDKLNTDINLNYKLFATACALVIKTYYRFFAQSVNIRLARLPVSVYTTCYCHCFCCLGYRILRYTLQLNFSGKS